MSRLTRNWNTSSNEDNFQSDSNEDLSEDDNDICNLEDIPVKWPDHWCIAGSTLSGKTRVINALLQIHGHSFCRIFAVCGSGKLNDDYNWLPPDQIIDPTFQMEKIVKLFKVQYELSVRRIEHPVCFIFDDILGIINSHRGKYKNFLTRLISSGRHCQISCIFGTQQLTGISPVIRDNCNYWIGTELNAGSITGLLFQKQRTFSDPYQLLQLYNRWRPPGSYNTILTGPCGFKLIRAV